MTTLERIKKLCDERNIPISRLESDLGYGNGSLKKPADIPSRKVKEIADYFNVSTDYLIYGYSETDKMIEFGKQFSQIIHNDKKMQMLKLLCGISDNMIDEVNRYVKYVIDTDEEKKKKD